jgi:hypothetical protein
MIADGSFELKKEVRNEKSYSKYKAFLIYNYFIRMHKTIIL